MRISRSFMRFLPPTGPSRATGPRRARAVHGKKAAGERFRELQRVVGSHARVHIAVGPIKDALTEAARRLHADVLVIGRSSQPSAQGRLRDLTYAVVRDAPCPVLSV